MILLHDWLYVVKRGDLVALQAMCQVELPQPNISVFAAQYGRLRCLQFLSRYGFGPDVPLNAADNGHTACLEYAVQQGALLSAQCMLAAARNADLVTMKLLVDLGCPWHSLTSSHITQFGGLEMLQFAIANGCPWDSFAVLNVARRYKAFQNKEACDEAEKCDLAFAEYVIRHATRAFAQALWRQRAEVIEIVRTTFWPIMMRSHKAIKIQKAWRSWRHRKAVGRELLKIFHGGLAKHICRFV